MKSRIQNTLLALTCLSTLNLMPRRNRVKAGQLTNKAKSMKIKQLITTVALLTCLSTLNPQLSTAFAQGTAFVYQGQLNTNGAPANGKYDLAVSLFAAASGGSQVGSTLTNSATVVSNGAFTVTLNFGSGIFTGSNLWLQIGVRTNGSGTFTSLSPRQQVMPVPYAIMANTASNLLGRLPAAQLGTGTANVSITGNAATATTANSFSGSLAGDVTGTQAATVVAKVGGQTAANVASGVSAANAAANINTASTIVKRDVSGNFAAGTITATTFTGNAATATTANSFSGSLAGDVTGTQGATVVAKVGGQTAANVASGATNANAATSANTANTIVKRDASGNFSASTVTANLAGNATTATSATTATTANSFSGSLAGDVTGTQAATVVAKVGGQTAANVASGVSTANAATNINTANAIVKRDASGNFLAGTITATTFNGNLNGSIARAGTATNFTGNLSGDVTGTQGATVVGTVGGVSGANVASGATAANNATSANTASRIVQRDSNGNFLAQTITLSGNLALPSTSGSSAGVLSIGGTPFLHAFGSQNTFVGPNAGNFSMSGGDNTAVGYQSLLNNTFGSYNTAIGYQALFVNQTAALGPPCCPNSSYNTANGYQALYSNTSGGENTAVGYQALYSNTDGNDNTANGWYALYANTDGYENTAIGMQALSFNTEGSGNIALGAGAGENITGDNNIDIGNGGTSSDNNIIRIGTSQTATYLTGTVSADSFSCSTSSGYGVFAQANSGSSAWGLLARYGTDGNNSAYLGGNGYAALFYGTVTVNGTFNNNSDRNAKENFAKVQAADVLVKVARLPVTEWNYKNDAATRHIGPMAQDFYAAFNVGTDERHIAPIDESGVALAAIQGLNEKLNEKDAEIQGLKVRLEKLEQLINMKNGGGQ